MDFSQIRYFLALSETLNFTRAAEKCNVTQPTLTQSIKRLEAELGSELVTRDGRHTRLTPLGRTLRKQFDKIEETRRLIGEAAAGAVSGATADLNIGVMCTVGPGQVSEFLRSFHEGRPKTLICLHSVTPEGINDTVLTGAFDGLICARHGPKRDRLAYQHLFEERMVVAFADGHRFGEVDSVAFSELKDENYLDRLHCEFRREFIVRARDADIAFNVVFSSEREDWIQYMVMQGMGVSIMPETGIVLPGVQCRPLRDVHVRRTVELVLPKTAMETGLLADMQRAAATWDWRGRQSV